MNPDGEYTVWLYGSAARGDSDHISDLDVFIALDEFQQIGEVRRIARVMGEIWSVSAYLWTELEGMASYGSLFLHHLRLEGRPLYESPKGRAHCATILSSLGPYRHAKRDVLAFRSVLSDVKESIDFGCVVHYELSVIATVMRHAGILGCYISGEPKFGRLEPVHRLVSLWSLHDKLSEKFTELYMFRLAADARAVLPFEPSMQDLEGWCETLEVFIERLEVEVDAYDRSLPVPNSPRA
ncbi:MAG: nucleotidyltransferase domain-containing protein [Syntrophobacteraceae bacterium]|jgi:hypothetical protein